MLSWNLIVHLTIRRSDLTSVFERLMFSSVFEAELPVFIFKVFSAFKKRICTSEKRRLKLKKKSPSLRKNNSNDAPNHRLSH